MHKGLIIASALLVASCDSYPEQPADQAGETEAATANDMAAGTDASDIALNQAVTPSGFAMLAAGSDMFEIASGKLAMENGQSAATRDFAKMMVDDHTASTRDLKAALANSEVAVVLPTRLDATQQGLLDRLVQADPQDFDREYMSQQRDAHQDAIQLHQEFQASSQDSELTAFSRKVLPVIRAHRDRIAQTDAGTGREMSGSAEQ